MSNRILFPNGRIMRPTSHVTHRVGISICGETQPRKGQKRDNYRDKIMEERDKIKPDLGVGAHRSGLSKNGELRGGNSSLRSLAVGVEGVGYDLGSLRSGDMGIGTEVWEIVGRYTWFVGATTSKA